MPTLMWIGKGKVANYHNEVPFPLLTQYGRLSVDCNGAENMLMTRDNLEALKALLPPYNNIKVIYVGLPDKGHSSLSARSM